MHIEIYEYIDGDEACETSEYLGYVSLEEDDVYIDIDDDKLAEQLEELFSEPFIYSQGVPGSDKEAEPYTEEFFRNVIPLLHDINARGLLKEDETDRYTPRTIDTEADDEEHEEIPLDMELSELGALGEDEYSLGSDEEDDDGPLGDEEGLDQSMGEEEDEDY